MLWLKLDTLSVHTFSLHTFSQPSPSMFTSTKLFQSSGNFTAGSHHESGSGRGCGCGCKDEPRLEDLQVSNTAPCSSVKDTCVLHQCSKPGGHGFTSHAHSPQCDEDQLCEATSGSEATMLTDATLSWLGSETDSLHEDSSNHSTCSTDSSSCDAIQAEVSI